MGGREREADRGNDGQTVQRNGQGTVEGKRKRGRERKRWTDSAEEWTGKPLAETQALAHDGNRWRRLMYSLSRRRPDDTSAS